MSFQDSVDGSSFIFWVCCCADKYTAQSWCLCGCGVGVAQLHTAVMHCFIIFRPRSKLKGKLKSRVKNLNL